MLLTYHFVLGLKSIIKLAFFFFFHNPIVTWGPCHHFTDVKSCGENRVFDFPEYLTQGHVRENLLRNCKHEMWMCWCSCPPVTSETIILTSLKILISVHPRSWERTEYQVLLFLMILPYSLIWTGHVPLYCINCIICLYIYMPVCMYVYIIIVFWQ